MDTWRQPAHIPVTLISEASGSGHRLQSQEAGDTVPFYREANQGLLTGTQVRCTRSLGFSF